jgi:membrane protein implicated in regulation of membrane protease activity
MICSIIAALLIAACVFVFVYAGMLWGLFTVIFATVFFVLTLIFKNLQEQKESKDAPAPTVGDFITGPVSSDKDEESDSDNNDKI